MNRRAAAAEVLGGGPGPHGVWLGAESRCSGRAGLAMQRVGTERSQSEGPVVMWAGRSPVLAGTGREEERAMPGWEAVPAILDGALSLAWR